ncbi:hypothetical protein DYQ91_10885, partial [Xanthomonas sp. LMG 8989]|nr:hypothetical protein [Xanthomonas sp. LMG 8989]
RIGERTVPREHERAIDGLRLPAKFLGLKDEQQSGAGALAFPAPAQALNSPRIARWISPKR